ncbi:hypothetical protein HDE_13660 [Halotydeus destructor]|nr:hypothetical protein HDE_13660 [Halotydeus destructor]
MMSDHVKLEKLIRRIPERHLHTIIPIMMSFDNDTQDFSQVHVRSSLRPYITEIIFLFVLMFTGALLTNAWMVLTIVKQMRSQMSKVSKSLKATYIYLMINCANDVLLKAIIVLPFSVTILVSLHWTFGSFWCHCFPLVQDVSFYWTSVSYVMLFYNRYKMAMHIGTDTGSSLDIFDDNYGFPAFWGSLMALFISVLGVVPYTVYIEFIDMGAYIGKQFDAIGFCVVNLSGNITDYIRVLFIGFYVVPIALSLSFHYRTCPIINSWTPWNRPRSKAGHVITCSNLPNMANPLRERGSAEQTLVESIGRHRHQASHDIFQMEKNVQHLLIMMFSVHTSCLFPINILRIYKHLIIETHENSVTFDMLFLAFVAIQFSSLVITPICFHWHTLPTVTRCLGIKGTALSSRDHSRHAHGFELNGSPSSSANVLHEVDEETECSAG